MNIRALLFLCLLAVGAALAVLLGGCDRVFEPEVKREYTRTETRVLWTEVKDEKALNAACSRTAEDKRILGCAVLSPDRGTCAIYTFQNSPFEVLGHEFMHCFTGRWHG